MDFSAQSLIVSFSIGRFLARSLQLATAGSVILVAAVASPQSPLLGTACAFGVLGGSTVTNTGPSSVSGDLGVSPGTAITGFPPGVVNGSIRTADAVAAQAQADVAVAYQTLAGAACNNSLTGQDLGGLTLTPGVYCFASSAQLTGTLTLDALGSSSAVFVFQVGSALTTASGSAVVLVNGASACNVYWQIGSSATFGTTTAFAGNVLASASITLNTGASLSGRALARTGAVTMDTNDVLIPLGCCTGVASWSNYGVGWPGTAGIPTLVLSGPPSIGTTPFLVVQNVYVHATFGLLLWGDGPVNIPTAYGGSLLVQAVMSWSLPIGKGSYALPLPIPLDPSLVCIDFNLQVLEYDKGASHFVAFTPGLHLVIGL